MVIFQPRTPALVIGLAVIFGAAIYPMYSVAVAHANDFAGPDEFVKIAGGLLLLLGIGTALGPIFAAQAMQYLFPEGLFAFAALVHLLLALYALFRMSRRPVAAKSERAFQGMPVPKTATPESAVLDPRAKTPPGPAAPAPPTPPGAGSPRPDSSTVIDLEPVD
jgi:MFS family permease